MKILYCFNNNGNNNNNNNNNNSNNNNNNALFTLQNGSADTIATSGINLRAAKLNKIMNISHKILRFCGMMEYESRVLCVHLGCWQTAVCIIVLI